MVEDKHKLLDEILNCGNLPTLPGVALQILELTRDPNAEINDLARLISTDPALSGKILKTVNSSFYGLSTAVATISQALVILGFQSVRTLALGFSLVGTLNKAGKLGCDLMVFWRRCIYSAVAARIYCDQLKLPRGEEAFLAALLQDIGVLAMHTSLGEEYTKIVAGAVTHDKLMAAEIETLGIDHQQVGMELAKRWSLPPLLSEPIGFHHKPDNCSSEITPHVRAIHIAWLSAEFFIQDDPSLMLKRLKVKAREFFQLQPMRLEKILDVINKSAHEMAELFEVNIGQKGDTQEILDQAREALVNLSLETQIQANQLENRNKQLQQAASTDPLTGLSNRQTLDAKFPVIFDKAKSGGTPISVLFIDADRFKSVNDTYGHAAGDEVLKRIAAILKAQCKKGLPCRYGGEEMVCLLADTGLRDAAALAEKVRAAIEAEVFDFDGTVVPVTVSIGVAGMESGLFYKDANQLVEYADKAMYDAKKSGRNTIRICPAGLALSV